MNGMLFSICWFPSFCVLGSRQRMGFCCCWFCFSNSSVTWSNSLFMGKGWGAVVVDIVFPTVVSHEAMVHLWVNSVFYFLVTTESGQLCNFEGNTCVLMFWWSKLTHCVSCSLQKRVNEDVFTLCSVLYVGLTTIFTVEFSYNLPEQTMAYVCPCPLL